MIFTTVLLDGADAGALMYDSADSQRSNLSDPLRSTEEAPPWDETVSDSSEDDGLSFFKQLAEDE